MQRPVGLIRQAWLFPTLATTLALVAAGWAAPSMAQSPAPSGSAAVLGPSGVVEAGTCPGLFDGLCSTVAVGVWDRVPYTPPIECGAGGTTGTLCQLQMEISAPTSGGPWPIVVMEVGGPADPGDLFTSAFGPFAAALAGQGAVVMVSGWRQADIFGGGYPTSFEDVACAVGVARQTGPAYGGDPQRVILAGHSNGGWPAMVLGLTPTPFTPATGSCDPTSSSLRPDAAVSMSGAIDLVNVPYDDPGYIDSFMGGDQATSPDAWAAADPFALVQRYPAGADAIPFLIIHGALDRSVLPAGSESFQAALVAAGYHSRLLIIESATHLQTLHGRVSIDAIVALAASL